MSRNLPVSRSLSLSFLLALVVAAEPVLAGTIRGVVTDPDGRRVPRARVILTGATSLPTTGETDERGMFHLTALAAGTYELHVIVEGFRAPPTVLALTEREDREVSIHLHLSAITESVVVTPTTSDVPLSRTADSVTVITETDLKSRQVETVAEALNLVPGLTVSTSGGRGGLTSVLPRGGESNFTLVLVDGNRLNSFGGGFDFAHLQVADIERIEVVRGPQSALYGSDAIGAVIQIITHHGGPPRAGAAVEGGSFGTGRLAASTSGASRAWEWGAAAERLATDGFTDTAPETGETVSNDDYRSHTVSLSGGWRSDRTRVRSDVRLASSDRGFPGPFGSDPGGTFGGVDRISRGVTDTNLWSLAVTRTWTRRLRQRAEVTYADLDGEFTSPFGPSTSETRRFTGRLQTDVAARDDLGLSVGLEFQGERARSTFITGANAQEIPIRRHVVGYFGEARFEPSQRLSVTTGVRVEQIHRAALEGDPSAFAPRPPFDADTIFSTNPKVSVSFEVWPPTASTAAWTRLRASAGTGIRPPDAFEIAFTDNAGLKPERSRSVDVGIEQGFGNGAIVMDATAFFNRYDDLIVSVGPALADLSRFRTDNIANGRARGVELSGATRTPWGFEMRIAYTWLDTEVLEVDQSDGQAPPPFTVGDPLLRRPRHQGSVDLGLSRGRLSGFLQLTLRGRRLDVDPSLGAFGGLYTAPGYGVVRLGAATRVTDRVEIYGRVNNLFDHAYEDALGFPALGRSVMVGARVDTR